MASVEHTASFELPAAADALFPLFSPEGERLWVPGWDYRDVMGTPDLSEDYVFLTESHDHGSTGAVWIVKRYDPERRVVVFYKVEPGDKVGVVTVRCRELGAERTEVSVTYRYVAISDEGEGFVAGFTGAVYEAFIGEWERLLRAHLGL